MSATAIPAQKMVIISTLNSLELMISPKEYDKPLNHIKRPK